MFKKSFRTRGEVFSYMLDLALKKEDTNLLEATKLANESARIYADNLGLPTDPPKGMEGYMDMCKKGIAFYQENESFFAPIATFLGGIIVEKFASSTKEENGDNTVVSDEINFDEVEKL